MSAADSDRRVFVEHMWGTAITIDVREPCALSAISETYDWFRQVDDTFSTWRVDSEISRYATGELKLSDCSAELTVVLELCDELRARSRGAFDEMVGSDPRVAPREGLGPIDPSGVVKGWALDRAVERLETRGCTRFAIAAGGDVRVGARPDGAEAWRVGIQHPWDRGAVGAIVEVTDAGVATSGRYERGDHVIDPRTAEPAVALMSATVVADDLALADGYATAAMVLGEEAMSWLTDEVGVAGMVVTNDRRVRYNRAFDEIRVDR
jgi:thiamine biosynthesis lipoprotein